MKDDITKKMGGIFDETGIFLALCHHRFSPVIADMVRSGELQVFILPFRVLIEPYSAKYLLACVAKLLDAFGEDLGGGFDIGCKFKTGT
jgi:Kyakuja-Dileera-Zisupton transposase